MIKDVIVNLSLSSASEDMLAPFAISVANLFGAHLSGIAFAYQPQFPAVGYNGVPAEYIDGLWAESRQRAGASIGAFNEAARRADLLAGSQQIETEMARAADIFAQIARRFDLSIVKQPERGHAAASDSVLQATLFGSGRPVLIVPYIHKGDLNLQHATVCWDGSRTAARAVADALPFLARATTVDVVIVGGQQIKSDEVSGTDIGRHLARHGLKIEIKRLMAHGVDPSNVILSYAVATATDLIVMGGYGHSRMREFMLGGVTCDILAAMTVPVLMSH